MQVPAEKVFACSSEHENYPASNLLAGDKYKKWKCKDVGEKSVFVTLELKEPVQINGIDIGNEHSCFIEVLVGRKGMKESDYAEILLTSSFMTPKESRNSDNPNRVRCFTKSALVTGAVDQKWDLVRVVCTQPFNSRVNYGISFITLYTPEEAETAPKRDIVAKREAVASNGSGTQPKPMFSFREESPETDTSESLFARWKQTKAKNESAKVSSAAADIRDATRWTGVHSPGTSLIPQHESKKRKIGDEQKLPDRNRSRLFYDDDDENIRDEKLERLIDKDKKRALAELEKGDHGKEKKLKEKIVDSAKKFRPSTSEKGSSPAPSTSSTAPCTDTPPRSSPEAVRVNKPKVYKPFSKLLEGVVLTISGIQNPERTEIRRKATELGAKYKSDWDASCTHLVCAFKNTPKYNQVRGVGKIVKRDWVLQCHSYRKKIPWRRYALDGREADKDESEDEIYDDSTKEAEVIDVGAPSEILNVSTDYDAVVLYKDEAESVLIADSGSDTEDEIEKINQQTKVSKTVFEATTEEDEGEDATANGHMKKTDFFDGKLFFLDDDIGAVKIIKLNSIITKYKGSLTESRTSCDFWIKSGTVSTAAATPGCSNKIVRPLWLEECADMDCLLPIKRYVLN